MPGCYIATGLFSEVVVNRGSTVVITMTLSFAGGGIWSNIKALFSNTQHHDNIVPKLIIKLIDK